MNSVKTKKGTTLPLMSLKGKPYMQVAHRIVWFNEDTEGGSFSMETENLVLTEDRAVIKATVKVFDKDGKLLKQGVGTKSESKKDFADFIEKAETGAVGRAITMLGYGTAYALADLDEGARIIDSPVTTAPKHEAAPKKEAAPAAKEASQEAAPETTAAPVAKKKVPFNKPGAKTSPPPAQEAADEWN